MEREKTISSRCSRQRQFFGVKSEYFFRATSDIEFCVFPRLDSSRGVSDKPQTMSGLRTPPVECSKLGKTQIIEDVRRGMVRNTGFCDQNVAAGCILELRIF